ncbi:MAG: GNAT family N-acetyltransferase [Actinomycetota bacterium]
MTSRLTIRSPQEADRAAIATLLTREQRAAADVLPAISHSFTEVETCAGSIELGESVVAVIASEAQRVVGVLTFTFDAEYAIASSTGFAIDPSAPDATQILAAMYAEAAPRLLERGASRHLLNHLALPALNDAVANLGLGRVGVAAARKTDQVVSSPTAVEVRVGDEDDLDTIVDLAEVERRFRGSPPIYGAVDASDRETVRRQRLRGMRNDGHMPLIARVDGVDAGVLIVERVSPERERLLEHERPFIGPTATSPQHRGRGVAAALVAAAVAHAARHGHDSISVSFSSANPLSRPFWLGAGFQPTGYSVVRAIHPAHVT